MAGLPHQTLARWQGGLDRAIALGPPHLSVYDLTVEPGTPFGKFYEAGCAPLPTDAATAQMYQQASEALRAAGYDHYEISNYARPGFQCRHNRVYWHNQPCYGFGLGAASYLDGTRFSRPRRRDEYAAWVAAGCPIAADPTDDRECLLETLMLGLRLAEGISRSALVERFGDAAIAAVDAALQPHRDRGWAIDLDGGRAIALSDPEGFLMSNQVLSDLFEHLDLTI